MVFKYTANVSLISVCSVTMNSDSTQICTWPRFLPVKGTDNGRPLPKLSLFAVNKAIVAVLESDPFNIKKLSNGDILIEIDKETQTAMTWPDGAKQPKKCAVEKQTSKVKKTSASSQTGASQNDPIKLKISQSKVYLTTT